MTKPPKKIIEPTLIASKTGFEILDLVRKYNSLPVNSPERVPIYEKIKDLVDYERYWD